MSDLTYEMAKDMKINPYPNEKKGYYLARLVYSATAHWMRYATQDCTLFGNTYKSKVYILNRGTEILKNLLECVPEAKDWFLSEVDSIDDVIRDIREKMLVSGELVEISDRSKITIPQYKKIPWAYLMKKI